MKVFPALLAAGLLALLPASAAPAQRVVSLGGDVTEIVYALGEGSQVVCDDLTSVYPQAAAKLPKVGYLRALAAEGVLSCKPALVIASQEAGPKAALTQLAAAKLRLVTVPELHSPEGVLQKIAVIAGALGVPGRGRALTAQVRAGMAKTEALLASFKGRPRAIFLMAHGPGGAMAAGTDTAADAMLALAHGENAAAGFRGYKPLTPEAAIALQPEVIVIDDMSLQSLGGIAAFAARPEIAMTPAAKSGRIVPVDTMFMLGFGPRTPEAIAALARGLHGRQKP
jgi:iron complex transport system substrate-binding protein